MMMVIRVPTIAELERELASANETIARLQQRVRELETAQDAMPTGMVRETARSSFVMPSADELRTIARFVRARYPQFGPLRGQDEDDYQRQFAAAFRALAYLNRIEKPDTKRALSYWIDVCRESPRLGRRHRRARSMCDCGRATSSICPAGSMCPLRGDRHAAD